MKAGRLEASIWWCGDEVCDCHQPIIEAIWPNEWDPRFVRRWRVWEGTFRSDGATDGLWKELQGAAARYGITLDGNASGGSLDGADVTEYVKAYAAEWPQSMKPGVEYVA